MVPGLATHKSRKQDFVRNPVNTRDERAGRITPPCLRCRIPNRLTREYVRLLRCPQAVVLKISFRLRSFHRPPGLPPWGGNGSQASGAQQADRSPCL